MFLIVNTLEKSFHYGNLGEALKLIKSDTLYVEAGESFGAGVFGER